VTTTYI